MFRAIIANNRAGGVYTERRGGYEHMLGRHHDLAITAEQRLAFVTLRNHAAVQLRWRRRTLTEFADAGGRCYGGL
jgi:hypothetical protein